MTRRRPFYLQSILLPPALTQDPPKKVKERVWIVAMCSFIAFLASVVAGMSGGVTSLALLELSNENQTTELQYFNSSSILPGVTIEYVASPHLEAVFTPLYTFSHAIYT